MRKANRITPSEWQVYGQDVPDSVDNPANFQYRVITV
jgi:hypothetical protein